MNIYQIIEFYGNVLNSKEQCDVNTHMLFGINVKWLSIYRLVENNEKIEENKRFYLQVTR